MTKKELLVTMMVDALKQAEDKYECFVPEANWEEREDEYNLIKFVWNYWVKDELAEEIASNNFDDGIFFDDYSDFEYFLTKLTYGEAFGISSKKADEIARKRNHITPIREKIESLLQG